METTSDTNNNQPIPYYRTLTAEEERGLESIREKLKGSEFEHISKDTSRLLRFLKARKFDVDASFDMLIKSMIWRRENKVDEITEKDFPSLKDSGKLMIAPMKDKSDRPVLLFWSGLHIAGKPEENVKYIIYHLEKIISNMPPGSEQKYIFLYDRLGFSRKNFDKQLISTVVDLLSNNYPETVSDILLIRTNWVFWLLWKLIKPFIDPTTAAKIKIVSSDIKSDLLNYFDENQLWTFFGGNFEWTPDFAGWKKLISEAGMGSEEIEEEEEEEVVVEEKEVAE